MPLYREAISPIAVPLPRRDLTRMVRTVRTLFQLSRLPAYRQLLTLQLPETARFNPGHEAVMMGYDFHLTPDGPKLIEVNTNAGGGLLAYLAHHPDDAIARARLPAALGRQFLESFAEEMRCFSLGATDKPRHIAIIDEDPENQYLYGEMVVFKELFEEWGARTTIADPARLTAGPEGVLAGGHPVDLIYNRHCDFYLERPEMAGIRAAYLAGKVCLTPNPHTYGLLADKRRMALWSDPAVLSRLGLDRRSIDLLAAAVPESRLLSALDAEKVWQSRKEWVFKPVSLYGSRGVFLGRKISRARFDALPSEATLVQSYAPPSLIETEQGPMKTDLRLFAYRTRVLGVAARLYQGQVTNLRTAGGGFAPVRIV